MNRVIKFRAWDVIGNKWVFGDLVHNQKITTTGLEPRLMVGGYEVSRESVGQFTGLHDKNGKEIYEGDIVTMYRTPQHRQKRVLTRHIVTCHRVCDWVFESLAKEVLGLIISGHSDFDSYRFEVIGNIYDNPELAKPYSLNLPEPKQRKKRNKPFKIEFIVKD